MGNMQTLIILLECKITNYAPNYCHNFHVQQEYFTGKYVKKSKALIGMTLVVALSFQKPWESVVVPNVCSLVCGQLSKRFGLDVARLTFVAYLPKANMGIIGELFHAPCRLEATEDKVHWYEQADTETLYELAGTARVAVAYAAVNGKHGHIKASGYLSYVLQFTKIALLFLQRVNLTEFLADYRTAAISVGQEARVPIVEVAGVKYSLTGGLYYPRYPAVGTASSCHLHILVAPYSAFGQPDICFVAGCTAVAQDVFRQYESAAMPPAQRSPLKNVTAEMVFMEMAAEHIQGLGGLKYRRQHALRVHPIVK